MLDKSLSVQEIKQKTADLMGVDPGTLSYITQEYLDSEFVEFDPTQQAVPLDPAQVAGLTSPQWLYVHNLAYGRHDNGRFVYTFLSGENGCSNNFGWLYQDEYNHQSTNFNCGPDPSNQVVLLTRA